MAEKRSIFEEVGADAKPEAAAQGGLIDGARRGSRGAIRIWLLVLFALVVLMIAVGGLTRLTDSGLSITEWRPVTGALPPLSDAAWEIEFEKYRQIPEYQLQNKGMSLSEFKVIYWWEWGHRQIGRTIGLVWAAGFLFFLLTRKIPTGWTSRLLFLGILGGIQGAIGWWMVASGLEGTMLDVASYRLAIHLGLAFVILGFIAWFALLLARSETELLHSRRGREPRLFSAATILMYFAGLQVIFGALVAGIDAGRTHNTWPLMDGGIFPEGAFAIEPIWRNFFENAGLVQFLHRLVGYLLLIFAVVVWQRSRQSGNHGTRFAFNLVLAALVLQMAIGVMTVLYVVPWQLAILHQLGAVALFVLILRARFLSLYPNAQSIRG